MSKTTENIIVVIIMVAIVIGLLCFVGYDNIKSWLSSPFIWKEPDFLRIEFVGTLEEKNDKKLLFLVRNTSEHDIDHYVFQVIIDTEVVEFSSLDASTILDSGLSSYSGDIKANGFTTLSYTCSKYNGLEETYKYFEKMDRNEIEELQYRVIRLESITEKLFSNNGWIKISTILAASLVLGLLGLVNKFPVWVRIVLKVCSLPIALFLVILFLLAQGRNDSSAAQRSKDSQYNSAQQRYNRAANQKAGAIQTGNTHSAAKAQEEMDWAMADMIVATGSGSSSARAAAARYKREASLKAGATITERDGDAARAQANMDKALADMMKNK